MLKKKNWAVLLVSGALGCALSFASVASDEQDAEYKAVLKRNDCFKCHAIDKTKKGPAYKKIAAKYKGKEAEGEEKIIKNITTSPKVKLEDGTEEEHKVIDITDQQELKKLARWIMSQ